MNALVKYTFLPLMLLAFAGTANIADAQQHRFQSSERCVAELSALDEDGDGYISDAEMGEYSEVATRVDTDGDGRISRDELVVACDDTLVQALGKGKGR